MNSTTKFQFKSIDVGAQGVIYRSPYSYDAYGQMTPRADLVKYWNRECRLREAELEIYNHETHNTRDELVQAPDSETGDKVHRSGNYNGS